MSNDMYSDMTVTGNTEILRDFVNYFENTHDDDYVYSAIHHAEGVTHEYLNDNCYSVGGRANYFYIDALTLSRKFPGLKFENIVEIDCDFYDFSIYINGKRLDYAEGDSIAIGHHEESKCKLCNTSLNVYEELCDDCSFFWSFRLISLVNSGQITEDEYFEIFEKRDFLWK